MRSNELEQTIREAILARLPIEQAPAMLRMAFHDAGTFDLQTHTGGADGSIHLFIESARAENQSFGPCLKLLAEVKGQFPEVSWADLIAVGGAAAVEKCQGPRITVELGRVDAPEPDSAGRLPSAGDSAETLKTHFQAMGLSAQDLVALSGGHTLGRANGLPFTQDVYTFSNSYFCRLLENKAAPGLTFLPSDEALRDDPELFSQVERYARDEQVFFREFSEAYQKVTWLGQTPPTN